jgi:aminoacrylate hydrolase
MDPASESKRPTRIVLLNGVYGAVEHFDALRSALAPEIETAVFPFRRGGLPDPRGDDGFTPMVERLHRALDWYAPGDEDERISLLGFSLGGALALEYLLAHPERVQRLVLVNAFGRYEQGPMQAGSLPVVRSFRASWGDPQFAARLVHRVPSMRRTFFHPEASLEVIEHGMRVAALGMSHDDVRFQLAHLGLRRPKGYEERLKTAAERTPILIAASRDDLVVPPRHSEWLARTMPSARVLPPFVGGHAFFQHEASALALAVREFMTTR